VNAFTVATRSDAHKPKPPDILQPFQNVKDWRHANPR
jgi:hypothetical protein